MFWWRKRRSLKPGFLVFGLGNPGPRYVDTRHNLGWWLLDLLAGRAGVQRTTSRHHSQVDYATLNGVHSALIKPTTFMNRSGLCVAAWCRELPEARFVVISDDVTLSAGKARLRHKGSSGGHQGLQSVIDHLHTEEFDRLRLGVGPMPQDMDSADYVLLSPEDSERPLLDTTLNRAADAVQALATGDFKSALETLALQRESSKD